MGFDGSKYRVGLYRKRFGDGTAGQGGHGYGGGVGQQGAAGWGGRWLLLFRDRFDLGTMPLVNGLVVRASAGHHRAPLRPLQRAMIAIVGVEPSLIDQ
jgi:hypothetical protein